MADRQVDADHKTIADFRRDNGPAIKRVCGQFVLLCRKLGLFGDAVVAIDGSKFKAVNNRDQNFTAAKMQRRLAEVEAAIARYMTDMDGADAATDGEARAEHLQEKLAALHTHMAELKAIDEQLKASPDGQVSLTDPDARSMNGRESGIAGLGQNRPFGSVAGRAWTASRLTRQSGRSG